MNAACGAHFVERVGSVIPRIELILLKIRKKTRWIIIPQGLVQLGGQYFCEFNRTIHQNCYGHLS